MAYPEEDIPFRQFMDDPDIQWRTGSRPDYTQVRELPSGVCDPTEYTQVGDEFTVDNWQSRLQASCDKCTVAYWILTHKFKILVNWVIKMENKEKTRNISLQNILAPLEDLGNSLFHFNIDSCNFVT